jgi:hypothetical protein
VPHACNPSYSGDQDQEYQVSKEEKLVRLESQQKVGQGGTCLLPIYEGGRHKMGGSQSRPVQARKVRPYMKNKAKKGWGCNSSGRAPA